MTEFRLDWTRAARTGTSEAVLCDPKSVAQVDAIVARGMELGRRLLLTRLDSSKFEGLSARVRDALDYDAITRTAILGALPAVRGTGRIAIVSGGTSDIPVAREAARTLAFEAEAATLLADVGVAGLWRLTERLDDIRRHRVVIAVAGMEGALFSVLTGLVRCAVIAVPTSIGYGVAEGGRAALHSALASCASGLSVVNIDNGFGAAHAALRILGDAPIAAPVGVTRPPRSIVALGAAGLASPAYASAEPFASFATGFAHPLGGIDHLLVMVTVGVWGVLTGGRALWVWPAVFVSTMLAGFGAATLGLQLPWVPAAVSGSVIVLGLLVTLAVRAPLWLGTALVALFAFFHGHAHGTEAVAASLIAYGAGLALATAGLHAAGIGLALAAEGSIGGRAMQAMGAVTVLGGLALIGT